MSLHLIRTDQNLDGQNPVYSQKDQIVGDPYRDLSDDEKFAYWFYLLITLICFITFGVLLYITYKVIRRVWDSDKIIPLMLINLQLAALTSAIFFIE